MMAKCLVELRSGTRYRGVYESRDSLFSVIKPPPLPSSPVPSKDVFCRAPKQDVFLSFP